MGSGRAFSYASKQPIVVRILVAFTVMLVRRSSDRLSIFDIVEILPTGRGGVLYFVRAIRAYNFHVINSTPRPNGFGYFYFFLVILLFVVRRMMIITDCPGYARPQ